MFPNFFQKITASRLRNKFILFFIILASVPVLVLGIVNLYLLDLSHRQDVSALELQLIDQKIEEIKKFFADTLGILELRVGFTQKSEIEISQQQFLLTGLLEENRAFEEVSFIDLHGKETAKQERGKQEIELLDVSRLPQFMATVGGKNFIGDVVYTLSGPLITLAAPVRNRNGDIIQVLSAVVNLSQIARSMETARLGASGYALLFDRDGVLISNRETASVPAGSDLSHLERVKRVLKGEILDALDYQDRYLSFFSRISVVGAGKKIPQIGWGIIVEWPIQDADAIIRDLRDEVARLTFFAILSVLLLAPFFASRLTRPIKILERGAAAIEQGDFEKLVDIKTQDELEELGAAFNRMSQGLKRLQELKNEFVFIAAHELRTPVTAIKGYLSMVREGSAGPFTEKLKQYIDPVFQANDRLIQLVNDILEIARSEAGKIKIEVGPCDLRESVRAILTEVKPLADQKRIAVSYEELKDLPEVIADTSRVKEVIMNLVSNAIKYNREGGQVKIYHEKAGDKVLIHVEDNGLGIPPEEQKRIFEKFFRAGSVKDIEGTGLGLFITKELVEKMGGKIWFISEEGKGTRFSLSLPLKGT